MEEWKRKSFCTSILPFFFMNLPIFYQTLRQQFDLKETAFNAKICHDKAESLY